MNTLFNISQDEQLEALKIDFLQWWHDVGEPELRGILDDNGHAAAFAACWIAFYRAWNITRGQR